LLEADGKEMVFLVPVCFCGAPIDAFCAVRSKNKRSRCGKGLINLESPSLVRNPEF